MASRFWVGGTGTWDASTTTHWATASNGAGGASAPTAADDAFIDSHSGGGTITLSAAKCRSLDCTGAPATTLAFGNTSNALTIGDGSGGAMTLVANISTTSGQPVAGQLVFASTSTNSGTGWPITTAGVILPGRSQFSGSGGKWVLQDNWTGRNGTTSGNSDPFVVSNGTLVLNGQTVTVPILAVSAGTLDCTNSTIVVRGTNTVFGGTPVSITGGTITGGSSSILQILQTSTNTRTFALGANTWGTITYTLAGSTGALVISGAATLTAINFSDASNARTLTFTASTTYTVTTAAGLNVQGTSGKLMTVNSSSSGTAATISVASGNVVCDYLSVKDSAATGGATFYAGSHSTSVSGNSGWSFTNPPVTLAGTTTGTSTTTGALKVVHPLAGSSAGTSTTAAASKVIHPLSGSSAGTSSVLDAVVVVHPLAGTTAGLSAAAAALKVVHPLVGTATGTSTALGASAVYHPLAGALTGAATASSALRVARILSGSAAGQAQVAAHLIASLPLAGAAAGTGTISGVLSTTAPVPPPDAEANAWSLRRFRARPYLSGIGPL